MAEYGGPVFPYIALGGYPGESGGLRGGVGGSGVGWGQWGGTGRNGV